MTTATAHALAGVVAESPAMKEVVVSLVESMRTEGAAVSGRSLYQRSKA